MATPRPRAAKKAAPKVDPAPPAVADPKPLVDGARLLATLQDPAQDPEVKKAYRRVFGGADGHLVLADILRRCRFAKPRTADVGDDVRRHLDGQVFLALAIARDAGFSGEALAVAVMSDQLEGANHATRQGVDAPSVRLDADPDF